MPFKCAFLGCGGRSKGHARAYAHVSRGRMVACCDQNRERLQAYGKEFEIPAQYDDLDEMLRKEKPDLVHVVTPPTIRVGLMTRLAEAGVPGVIVEKPICIGADDYRALRSLERNSRTKFAVNHQLRHHPRVLDLLKTVREGGIGEVRFLDASAVLPMSGQGVHVLDLLFAFAGYPEVGTVFGASSGYDDINGTHPSPRTAESLITFRNGMRAALQAGEGAPIHDPTAPTWGHKRISVYGTHGFVQWWMQGWERSLRDGTVEKGSHAYADEDVLGEAGLIHAMLDWLEDDGKPCPTRLSTALDEWQVILAGYLSTVEARPVAFPFDPPDDLLDRFKRFVGAA
ncbi:MAG: Gfo/Idh/MocA family oxidoreductase [Candidatus Latescibacteria bacterium]|nr:Gfo/Idh/MocA family oxidoreductase [Candidatus Latescibacterota bacterium]